ncbi:MULTISPECIES: hypothetical protein [unclassified Halorhabdus]|uniref:DUF5789 family protein n=1 Tax=unclassified Halorhabdus TaxID=2621901 RepID=UPI0023DA4594|nr:MULTISPECIES: hypothetical protein [unclassified Halorhabdus]WEL17241.1 Uncharacterized protein SVXHr_1067 [Halorhabdus sp. SVX81]WEL21123.1 Uncharacterized protein HBNXHr_1055 [Halorhabdus sp. BNX81]
MGVRPPADDGLSEPDVIEFGIPALDARLEDASFPATAEELRAEHGDLEVPYNASGNTVSLEDVLDEIDQRNFETEQDLLNATHPVFERLRAENPSGIVGQIRSLIPF